jgi:predicted dehydrogenase
MSNTDSVKDEIKLAMVGFVEGNGHPYSWSAIINGYDPQRMAESPFPVIAEYLGQQPLDEVSISNATVSHIWTDDQKIGREIAETTYIPNIADNPSDILGAVDGIIIPTDDGDNHVNRVQPFIGADLPIFVDKPLATNVSDLSQFVRWHKNGLSVASSSAMRYAPVVDSLIDMKHSLHDVQWVTNATHKTWQRYGIHTLEPVARLFGAGFDTVKSHTEGDTKVLTITHKSGPTISIGVNYRMRGGFSRISLYGDDFEKSAKISDTYTTFRRQLQSVVDFVADSSPPVQFSETVDLMACIIAGRWSVEQNRSVSTAEVYDTLPITMPT